MSITSITVSFSQLENMGDYRNVKPSVSFTADLVDEELPDIIRQRLANRARQHVHNEIDSCLEEECRPPKYYAGPRFVLWKWINADKYLLMSLETALVANRTVLPGHFVHKYHEDRSTGLSGHRYEKLYDYALQEGIPRFEIYDVECELADWAFNFMCDNHLYTVVDVSFDRGDKYPYKVTRSIAITADVLCVVRDAITINQDSPIGNLDKIQAWAQQHQRDASVPIIETLIEFEDWRRETQTMISADEQRKRDEYEQADWQQQRVIAGDDGDDDDDGGEDEPDL